MASQVMQETLTATSAAVAATHPGVQSDPLMLGLAGIVGVVTLVIAIGKPIRDYLRQEKRQDKADIVGDARSSAEAVLYNHLSEQVTEYRRIADEAFRERNALISRVAALEAKAVELEQARALTSQLQAYLSEKDAQLQALLASAAEERKEFLAILRDKDTEIQRRDIRIAELEHVVATRLYPTPQELPDGELIG